MYAKIFRLGFDADEKITSNGSMFNLALSDNVYDPKAKEGKWCHYSATIFAKSSAKIDRLRAGLKKGVWLYIEAEDVVTDDYAFDNGKKKQELIYPKIKKFVNPIKPGEQQQSQGAPQQQQYQAPPQQQPPQRQQWGNQPMTPEQTQQAVAHRQEQQQKQPTAAAPAGNFDDFDDDIPF